MAIIKNVGGIHPSNSGNTRVIVTFKDATPDMHYYMKPDGSLHFPKEHDEHTLDNPFDGYEEMKWVWETWTKNGNKNKVVHEELSGDKRVKAVALCLSLLDPIKRKKVIELALIEKSGKGKLGESKQFKETFTQLKKKITTDNKQAPAPKPQSAQPTTPKQEEKPVAVNTSTESVQKADPPYGGVSRVDKFKKKYSKTA